MIHQMLSSSLIIISSIDNRVAKIILSNKKCNFHQVVKTQERVILFLLLYSFSQVNCCICMYVCMYVAIVTVVSSKPHFYHF